nr:MAG TPA: hypothetical protein [Caudoviricetes sp.]
MGIKYLCKLVKSILRHFRVYGGSRLGVRG